MIVRRVKCFEGAHCRTVEEKINEFIEEYEKKYNNFKVITVMGNYRSTYHAIVLYEVDKEVN